MSSLCNKCCLNERRSKASTVCRQCHNAYNRKSYKRMSREKQREKSLKNKYGVEYIWFEQMYLEQKGMCAVCLEPIEIFTHASNPKKACLDHNHTTGKIRGILCSNCNRAAGLLYDDINRIDRLKEYLQCHVDI